MSLMRFNYRSSVLGKYLDISIVLPTDSYDFYDPEKEKYGLHGEAPGHQGKRNVYHPGMKFQTVYLIHGGGDDDSLTYRYTNAERYAQENNVMLVTPDIANSFGVDADYGIKYQTFLAKELPVVIQSLFPSSPKREDNFIMGYAMGGNVALGTAIMHPELFSVCVDMSGGIGMTLDNEVMKEELSGSHFKSFMPIYNSSFGEAGKYDGSAHDLYAIAKSRKESGEPLCRFYVCCGSEEFIRYRVEKDVDKLRKLGYDAEYILAGGYTHDFRMWDDYIRIMLDEILPLKRFGKKDDGEGR